MRRQSGYSAFDPEVMRNRTILGQGVSFICEGRRQARKNAKSGANTLKQSARKRTKVREIEMEVETNNGALFQRSGETALFI